MISPEDVPISISEADRALVAKVLNMVLENPRTRDALVRELITRGHCSPSVWAVRAESGSIYEIFASKDDADSIACKGDIVQHWKGQTE